MNNTESLFLLLLLIPIILSYLLNIKGKVILIGDITLWNEIANSLKHKLSVIHIKNIASLIMNVLAITLVVTTLSGFTPFKRNLHVLVIDTSPSTQAGNRLEAIKAQAIDFLDKSVSQSDQVAVATSAGSLLPFTNDLESAKESIKKLEPTSNYTRLQVITDDLKKLYPDAMVNVFTDGQEKILTKGLNIFATAREFENVAITQARMIGTTVWLKIKNYSHMAKEVEIVTKGGGKKIILAPGNEIDATYKREREIKIVTDDDFKADNHITLDFQEKKPVLVYSDKPNQFTEKVLNTISPNGLKLHISKYDSALSDLKSTSIFIFDSCLPDKIHDGAAYVFLGVVPGSIKPAGTVKEPKNVYMDSSIWPEPLGLPKINVKKSLFFQGGKSLIHSDEGPLAILEKNGNRTLAVLGFQIEESDFAISPAFPLFFKGLLNQIQSQEQQTIQGFLDESESDISSKITGNSQMKETSLLEKLPFLSFSIMVAVIVLILEWLLFR